MTGANKQSIAAPKRFYKHTVRHLSKTTRNYFFEVNVKRFFRNYEKQFHLELRWSGVLPNYCLKISL